MKYTPQLKSKATDEIEKANSGQCIITPATFVAVNSRHIISYPQVRMMRHVKTDAREEKESAPEDKLRKT